MQFNISGCEKLNDGPTATWTPPSCSSGVNNIGASCSLQCDPNFVLKGSAFVQCTENGWNSSNGNFIPQCVRKFYFRVHALLLRLVPQNDKNTYYTYCNKQNFNLNFMNISIFACMEP